MRVHTRSALLLCVPLFAGTTGQISAQAIELASSGPRFIYRHPQGEHRDASNAAVLQRRVSLRLSDVTVETALDEIARQAKLELLYSRDVVRLDPRAVSIDAKNLTVAAALTEVLIGAELDVLVSPTGQLALTRKRVPASEPKLEAVGQQWVVSGIVVNRRGTAVIGATVAAVGLDARAVTDAGGRFRLEGRSTAGEIAIRVTMVGYEPLNQTVRAGASDLRMVLNEMAVNLDEVVVTGTAAATQKRAIGNSVITIDAKDVTAVAPIKSVTDLINGRAPGVVVFPGRGQVGVGPRIRIRGRTSISLGGEPLVYIDGIRVNNDVGTGTGDYQRAVVSRIGDLDPDQIESIEIVKGPAAATLYGTEASNGVIQIITKKGAIGDRPAISLSVRQGGNWFMDAEGRIPHTFAKDPATGAIIEQNLFASEAAAGRPIFKTGHSQGYGVDVSGGSQVLRYYAGATADRDEGVEPNNDFDLLNGRVNLTVTPKAAFDVTTNVGVIRAYRNLGFDGSQSSVLGGVIWGNPLTRNGPLRGFFQAPPEVIWNTYKLFQEVDRYTAGITVNHRPRSWFRHHVTVGSDHTAESNGFIAGLQPDSIRPLLPGNDRGGRITDFRNLTRVTTFDYGATASTMLGKAIQSNTSFGTQYFKRRNDFTLAFGSGFPAPGVVAVGSAASLTAGGGFSENVTLGFFAQQELGLSNRLFATGAVRVDNNSAFGSDFDWVTYPKVSASWVLSEEPFWKIRAFDVLRLRVAYGQSGRQPATNSALATYSSTTGAGSTNSVTPNTPGNPSLRPERGEEVEAGFETSLFDQRISIDFTYYNKRTRDVILNRAIAPSLGYTGTQIVNAGTVSNKGIEAKLALTPVRSRTIRWDLTTNVSTNDNKILDLDPAQPNLTFIPVGFAALGGRYQEGFPIAAWFQKRVVSATLNPATGRAANVLCDGGAGPNQNLPGGPGVPCSQAPAVYLGRPTAKVEGSVGNQLTFFDRLQLHVLVDFKTGYRMFDVTHWVGCASFRVCEAAVRPQNYDPTYIAELESGLPPSQLYSDASFARLREIAVSYSFPTRWARLLGARTAVANLSARNLRLWTNYSGLDPENAFASIEGGGEIYADQNFMPQLSSILVTVRLGW